MITNKYVYIELLRQVCPYDQPFIGFNYFLLGSFDAMFIDTDNSIAALKKKYENRYSEVLSVFDRQPVYMYSKKHIDINDKNCIFNTSDPEKNAVPLVLTLFQLDKLSLAKRQTESPEKLINEFSNMLAERINEEHVDFQVFWNLGESDIVTVFRTDYLNEIAFVLHSLRVNGLSDETMNIISTSSHCAFPLPSTINNETCKDPELCKELLRDPLEKWLLKDDEGNSLYNCSDFITLGNVASNDEPQFHKEQLFSFLFGEWDYMLQFKHIDDLINHLCDTFACLITTNKQLSNYAPFRVSYTIPMFQLGIEAEAEAVRESDQQGQGITEPEKTEEQPGDCKRGKEPPIPPAPDPVRFLDDLSANMNTLHTYIHKNFSPGRRKNLCAEINSFKNSLNGLGKFLYRLRIGRFEEDLYVYIQPVFERLAAITKNYTANIEEYINEGKQTNADNLVIEYLEDTSMLIENLQHLFSVMAVSPHTYMETYGSNMRSLAAADKLLNAYQGIIKFLKDSFPDQYIHDGNPKSSRREILIFPYRKTQSSHTLLYRHSHPADRLSYISLDFSKMFDPTGTIFMLLHECGHHLGNRLREERFRLFYAALVCDILYKAGVEKYIQTPIEYLVQIIGQKNAYAYTDSSGTSLLFQGLAPKKIKGLSKKYEDKIRRDIGEYTYSIGVSCAKDHELIDNYKDYPIFPNTVDLWNNYYSAQILEYLKTETIPQYFGVDKHEMSFERVEHMKQALRDKLKGAFANPLKEITKKLAYDISRYHGNTREALRIRTMYADTEQIVSDLIDPLEQIISDSWNSGSPHVLLSIFSNIYSDLFAITILDLSQEEYLDVIKKLLGIERIGLITSNNLLRFYAVCESKWNNTDVSLFTDIFKIDMSADGKKRWELIQYNPYYPFLLEYAKDCLENLKKDVEEKKHKDKKPFDMLKNMTGEDNDKIDSIYYFYQYLMGGEERKAQT